MDPGFERMDEAVRGSGLGMRDLIAYFRTKCRGCGHHRIMHDESGACEGVMNKPCMSGCDGFVPE